jgi:MFS family permease
MGTMQAGGQPEATAVAAPRRVYSANGRLGPLGYLALAVACLAVFVTALDQTVVVTALFAMVGDVGLSVTEITRAAWIVNGYLLGYVIAMPLMGRIADIYGRWRVFVICLVIFALGSLFCALAPDLTSPISPDTSTIGGIVLNPIYSGVQSLLGVLPALHIDTSTPGLDVLVAARFIQAVGGGALVPVALAIVGDLFGTQRRGVALGLIGAATEAGGVLGPLWGAFVTSAWGWRWIFYLNIPLAAVLLLAGFFAVPRVRQSREPIDILGALLFGAALTCLAIGLGQQTGQLDALNLQSHAEPNVQLLIAAAVLLLIFAVLELLRRAPVVDLRLFARRAFSASAVLSLLIGTALIVALVVIPAFMDTLIANSPLDGGLTLLRMTVFIPVGALAGGGLSSRIGCRPAATLGVLLTALGLWLMHLWPRSVDWTQITVATVIAGLGFGLVIAPINTSALNASPRRQTASAASVVTVLRMTGMILGLAGLTAWGLDRFRSLVATIPPPGAPGSGTTDDYVRAVTDALHQVYGDIFAVAAALTLVGLIPALLLWRRPRAGTLEDTGGEYESYVAPLA